jgi:hypothetical protein
MPRVGPCVSLHEALKTHLMKKDQRHEQKGLVVGYPVLNRLNCKGALRPLRFAEKTPSLMSALRQ